MSTSITFQQGAQPTAGYTGCIDTGLDSSAPTVNFDADGYLGMQKITGRYCNTIIRFNLSSIPANVIVLSATLTLKPYGYQGGTPFNVSSYPLKRAWSENQATWNIYSTGNSWQTAGGLGANDIGAKEGTTAMPTTGNVVFSIPSMVQGWINGSLTNYGVNLITDTLAAGKYWFGIDSENATAASRPYLTVVYGDPPPPPSTRIRDVIGMGIVPYKR